MSQGVCSERTHRHRVLVVDDSFSIREMVGVALAVFGYDSLEARSGDEALSELREHHVCSVLLDMRMPGMDGAAFLRALAASTVQRPPSTIAMSGSDELLRLASELGVEEVLAKPFPLAALWAALDRVTARELADHSSARLAV